MDAVGVTAVVASVVLGVSFVVAGASKIASGDGWPVEAAGLGAPSWTIPIVPWFEVSLGALLVVQLARRPTAAIAIAVLVVFTTLIANRLRRGEHPPCACFGAWSAKPIGPGHLVRNGVLIALAVLALL